MSFIFEAVKNLAPEGSAFSHTGDTIDGLEWIGPGERPTDEAINAEVAILKANRVKEQYKVKRMHEYPSSVEFLDAWVKNDEVALESYRQKCLAVKAKYPKPE